MFATKQAINTARRFAFQQPASARFFHATKSAKIVTELTDAQAFRDTVLKSPVAFVDFYATWCGPCKMISPYVEKFSEMHKTVDFYKIDVDEVPDIATYFGISAMPTFLVFKHGEVVDKIVGANPQGINNALINATKG